MRQFIDLTVVGVALLIGILLTGWAQAEVVSSAPADQVDAVDGSGWGDPLSGGELHGLTGGQNIQIERIIEQISNTKMDFFMDSPAIEGSPVTGYNMLATGALNNVSGIATVIQNSGNQVIINSATILNLYVD